jgi:hypothetical protein
MVQSSGNERLTAFVSTVVAVAILAAGLTAHQNQAPATGDIVQMASDLRFQFEMAFRHDTRERDTRLAQLDTLMTEWQASPQSVEDRDALLSWLQTAAGRSLPGAMEPLPDQPKFSQAAAAVVHEVNKMPAVVEPVEAAEHSAATGAATLTDTPTASAVPTPVTPTPSDPLEEEMIALRQPPSLNPDEVIAESTNLQEVAPRPGLSEPQFDKKNLLASLPVAEKPDVEEPVAVNLTELVARIAGYHDALDEVETSLLRLDSPNLDVVTEQIHRLDTMTRDYGFVELYYESLTPAERQTVSEPRSMESTLSEVERQLKGCEETLDGDYLGSFNKAAEEEIAKLRTKLAEIEKRIER